MHLQSGACNIVGAAVNLRVQKLAPNVLGVDTVARLDPVKCRALVNQGVKFRGGYIDELNAIEIEQQVGEKLPLLLYTYANEFNPQHTLDRLSALSVPAGANVVLDVEAVVTPDQLKDMTPPSVEDFVVELKGKINAWGKGLLNHAFLPTIYFGGLQLLTSEEMTSLAVYRYHEGAARLLDRFGKFAVPERGYAMLQGRPVNVKIDGCGDTLFDWDFHREDYHGDVFSVLVAA